MATAKFSGVALETFLTVLRSTGNASAAARAAGVSLMTAHDRRRSDQSVAERWDEALETYYDDFEAAAAGRAMHGVAKPRTLRDGSFVRWPDGHPQAGQIVYDVTYSDGLVPTLLKAHRPERHRDRSEQLLTARVGQIEAMDDAALIEAAQAAIEDARIRQIPAAAPAQPAGEPIDPGQLL